MGKKTMKMKMRMKEMEGNRKQVAGK